MLPPMIQPVTIQLLAARAASVLVSWAGLDPTRKHSNGDNSEMGLMTRMLGVLADRSSPPPPDAEQRIRDYLIQLLTAKADKSTYLYVSMSVDYGPDRELADLAQACGLNVSWPNKSSLYIEAGDTNPGSVLNRQGYGSEGIYYSLVHGPVDGTLITRGFQVDSRIRAIVARAVLNGETDAAVWEPSSPDSDRLVMTEHDQILAAIAQDEAAGDDDFEAAMTGDES